MEFNQNAECKTLSQLYRDMGKPMKWREFVNTFNEGGHSVEYLIQKIEDDRKKVRYAKEPNPSNEQLDKMRNDVVCNDNSNNWVTGLLLIGVVALGVYYLSSKNKD